MRRTGASLILLERVSNMGVPLELPIKKCRYARVARVRRCVTLIIVGYLCCPWANAAGWTVVAGASPPWMPSYNHTTLVFNDQLYVLGGWGRAYHSVWRSLNGINWFRVQNDPAWDGRTCHTTVVYQDKLWIVNGVDHWETPYGYEDIWASSDGAAWEEVLSRAPWIQGYQSRPRFYHTSVVFNDRIWMLGGVERFWMNAEEYIQIDTYHHDVWSSADGAAWDHVADAPWVSRYGHTSVVFEDKMWVLGGYSNSDNWSGVLNDVWSSPDGITWTEVTHRAPWCPRMIHASVVYGGMLWVVGGAIVGSKTADAWASPDGVSWVCVTDHGPFGERLGHTCTAYDGKIWLMGGWQDDFGLDRYTDVWTFDLGGEGEGEGAVELEGVDWVHAADQDGDAAIDLSELLRVIQFYNVGAYQCAEDTEDGYLPGAGATACTPHSSDYNPQDWIIDMPELLRLIQFYNSDGYCYYPSDDSEDGYWPCSAPPAT